ncbi:(2Fe-2S)-binding protein [candidate division WOR-3 bacterium]|uniref:(2Fe-2S)-binding protein n=1 Tax=candidate division WOR-3 bacterium TaxID=2052148 RepID=A0A937XGU2_UNCW3|nr:(2Fe-2S)-binding protein [candidate division WOR-3 bacterium]
MKMKRVRVVKRSSGRVTRRTAKPRSARTRSLDHGTTRALSSATVCRCEEVSEADVRRVIRMGYHSLEAVKRVLRTGMGHCQGRGCLKLVARMIQEETGIPASEQKMPRPRPPLKPLPLGLLGAFTDEARSTKP